MSTKGHIKSLLGHLVIRSKLYALSLHDFAPVIAFHRISKTPTKDSLTYDLKSFKDFCTFLSSNFHVVPLTKILEKLKNGEPFKHEIAITFDDGYQNNFELAPPVLKALNLPATFFITTRFIGTEFVPWWDINLGVRLEWMTWDQVRELHRLGFDIGSHTQNHVDLGKVSKEVALNELVKSRKDLEEQISSPVTLFAYPYGRRDNITPDNRELVRVAGYLCCCSCFGGLNKRGTDPFHLQRIPISNWYHSPHDFVFQLTLHRV
jgi:peptidoglycan/xylan/chitin deacetylase (PgdA/CDA1 family)